LVRTPHFDWIRTKRELTTNEVGSLAARPDGVTNNHDRNAPLDATNVVVSDAARPGTVESALWTAARVAQVSSIFNPSVIVSEKQAAT
jgi:hypothetical protein